MDTTPIIQLQNANGANAKKAIISANKDNDDFKKFLYYALNPMLTYKVSEATLKATKPCNANAFSKYNSIFDICEELSKMKAINNNILNDVVNYLDSIEDEKEKELCIGLLAKTVRLGVTNGTVNKIIDGLIDEWEVQQGYPIDKYPIKEGTWFTLTQKLNGVRGTYYQGKIYARSGIPYEGLDHITSFLDKYNGMVFDGELTLTTEAKGDMTDNEAFRMATGIINSEAEVKAEIQFTIFDIVDEEGFELGKSHYTYRKRRELMNREDMFVELRNNPYISILPTLYQGTDQAMIDKLLDKMVAEDKEGLMVNTDVQYQRKRHRGILKVKRFYTMDLEIVDILEGDGRLAGTLGALVVDYKGNTVNVGTGFDDATREYIWTHKEDIMGHIVEVKYKEISTDKKSGLESLQFPVFVGLRFDKNSESFA